MPDIPRLNPAIRALESGKPAFVTFSPAEIGAAQSIAAAAGGSGPDRVAFATDHTRVIASEAKRSRRGDVEIASSLRSSQ